mmetsp:Transcript_7740/g.11493  ORF Transcript_7740/g.11493 Transcript_7740/m.11493 type:complete len:347 (-) Transcript_7740:2481-3521(-)
MVTTLSDLNRSEERRAKPFPNAWAGSNSKGNASGTKKFAEGQNQNMIMNGQTSYTRRGGFQMSVSKNEDIFWSQNVEHPKHWQTFCLMCIPCFIGHPFSKTRLKDYLRFFLSTIVWISIIQIIYFIVSCSIGGFASPSDNPMLGPSSDTLLKLGAKYVYGICHRYEIYRLVVPIFMHAGILHIATNLIAQYFLGLGYERQWTFLRFLPIYFVSGIGGNLLSCVALPDNISVGASGAIMGLFGAKIGNIICRFSKISHLEKISYFISMSIFLVVMFAMSFFPNVDWAGHLGGLLCGLLMGFLLFGIYIPIKIIAILVMLISFLLLLAFFLTFSLLLALVIGPKYTEP